MCGGEVKGDGPKQHPLLPEAAGGLPKLGMRRRAKGKKREAREGGGSREKWGRERGRKEEGKGRERKRRERGGKEEGEWERNRGWEMD